MVYFLFILIIVSGLVFTMDGIFYHTISEILTAKGLASQQVLLSLGYDNGSIFKSKLSLILLVLTISLIIYSGYLFSLRRKKKVQSLKIKDLEQEIIKINKGDYGIEIVEEDEYSLLRDEIYKIIIHLKTMEEEARNQKGYLKNDLSNIAHQLKTPITSIGMMTELIQTDPTNGSLYLEKLIKELVRLEQFTEILLKLSQINSDTIDYQWKKVAVKEMVMEIVEKLNRSHQIKVDYSGEEFQILADEVWLYEGLINLLKNSIEHTKDRLSITFYSNQIYGEIIIKDNGPGIAPDNLNKIFNRFYRGNTTVPGYGIGLNLAQTIIQKHQGDIQVWNDHGSVFKVKFYHVT